MEPAWDFVNITDRVWMDSIRVLVLIESKDILRITYLDFHTLMINQRKTIYSQRKYACLKLEKGISKKNIFLKNNYLIHSS